MPRARTKGQLMRIPVSAAVAYDLTYNYPPSGDLALLQKHVPRLYKEGRSNNFAFNLEQAMLGKVHLTVKQRLALLQMEYPKDARLKSIKGRIERESDSQSEWGRRFRRNPAMYYQKEREAVEHALTDLGAVGEGVSKLEAILGGD